MKKILIPVILLIALALTGYSIIPLNHTTAPPVGGRALAKAHCVSCHSFPEPSLLNKESWERYILPRMGYMLGVYTDTSERGFLMEAGAQVDLFPEEPIIEEEDWEILKQYYIDNAPEKLSVPDKDIKIGLDHFELISPEFTIKPPTVTLAKFMDDNTIYVGDALSKSLVQFDNELNYLKSGKLIEGPVHIHETDDEYWILSMGSFSPTDIPGGLLLSLPKTENRQARVIADQLKRPVHASYADLNDDGLMDIVVSEFAKWTGELTLLINTGNYNFRKKVLSVRLGATKTFIRDFNKDGRPDIMALFGQGDEGISIFYNYGNNEFIEKEVVELSASHGSSSFEIFDLGNDGDWDILYTAGDNADFKPILKPYHGIYIFENDGDNKFAEKLFYHLNGAYGAKIHDYDKDGDLDIAAISFFPDYSTDAKEGFVYLENTGDFHFEASTFENNTRGRWIIMDAADKDDDGDMDLILGSLVFEVIPDKGYMQKWIKSGLPFVILENSTE